MQWLSMFCGKLTAQHGTTTLLLVFQLFGLSFAQISAAILRLSLDPFCLLCIPSSLRIGLLLFPLLPLSPNAFYIDNMYIFLTHIVVG